MQLVTNVSLGGLARLQTRFQRRSLKTIGV